MAHAEAARLVAALALAVAVGGCATGPARVAAAPDTVAALPGEPRIVAVHYHDLLSTWTPAEAGRPGTTSMLIGAPARRIKDRFLQDVQSRVPLRGVRDVAEPRFAYLGRELVPEMRWLQRTFARGLVFEFYAPPKVWRAGVARGPVTIHARLVRLDDLAVLWADSCTFDPGPLQGPEPGAPIAGAETFYVPAGLQRADACADTLRARDRRYTSVLCGLDPAGGGREVARVALTQLSCVSLEFDVAPPGAESRSRSPWRD